MRDWKEYRFSDFAEISPQVALKAGAICSFVEMADLKDGNKFCEPVQVRTFNGSGTRFQERDTLFARITPCLENGKICQVRNLLNKKGFGSTEFHVFRGREGLSDTDFVYYLSRSSDVRYFAEANFHGTSGRQRVPRESFNNLYLKLPDFTEQRAIAGVLSSLDDKIDLLHRQNKTLEGMAEALWRKMFVEEADPNWKKGKLGDVCVRITKGTTPTTLKRSFVDTGINFIKAESIDDYGNFITEKFAHIDEETNTLISRSIVQENDILYTIAGTIGRTAVVTNEILPANTNQAIAIITLNNSTLFLSYIRLLLKTTGMANDLDSKVVHAVQPNLSLGMISDTDILIPDEQTLIEFNKKSNPLFVKTRHNTLQIRTLSGLRDTLLPKLMSGEMRVRYAA